MIFCLHDDVDKLNKKKLNSNDILTFDDGHYSVFKNRELLKSINNEKIIFITPSYVSLEHRKFEPDLSEYYQYDYRINNKSQFMTLEEIEILISKYNFKLGMHSFYHDFVYIHGKNQESKIWRMYKISANKNIMKLFNKFFTIKSKLSTCGYEFIDNKMKERQFNDYLNFIKEDTEKCVDWFKRYLYFTELYAYPFFNESKELNNELLKYNITKLYGNREHI